MFEELNIKQKDKYFLLFILIYSIILVGYYINFNNNLGIYCSDVYVYLLNALYYTGTNIRSTGTIYLSPLICFLTSIFFNLGFVDKQAIYIVTGAFAIFGGDSKVYKSVRYFFTDADNMRDAKKQVESRPNGICNAEDIRYFFFKFFIYKGSPPCDIIFL